MDHATLLTNCQSGNKRFTKRKDIHVVERSSGKHRAKSTAPCATWDCPKGLLIFSRCGCRERHHKFVGSATDLWIQEPRGIAFHWSNCFQCHACCCQRPRNVFRAILSRWKTPNPSGFIPARIGIEFMAMKNADVLHRSVPLLNEQLFVKTWTAPRPSSFAFAKARCMPPAMDKWEPNIGTFYSGRRSMNTFRPPCVAGAGASASAGRRRGRCVPRSFAV